MNETVNATIKRKFGAFVRSRRWWKRFRELVIKCVVHNLEQALTISHTEGIGRTSEKNVPAEYSGWIDRPGDPIGLEPSSYDSAVAFAAQSGFSTSVLPTSDRVYDCVILRVADSAQTNSYS